MLWHLTNVGNGNEKFFSTEEITSIQNINCLSKFSQTEGTSQVD